MWLEDGESSLGRITYEILEKRQAWREQGENVKRFFYFNKMECLPQIYSNLFIIPFHLNIIVLLFLCMPFISINSRSRVQSFILHIYTMKNQIIKFIVFFFFLGVKAIRLLRQSLNLRATSTVTINNL